MDFGDLFRVKEKSKQKVINVKKLRKTKVAPEVPIKSHPRHLLH